MLKEANPDWGCQRISDILARGPALPASPTAVVRVLKEAGYELEEVPTRRHPGKVRRFERARWARLGPEQRATRQTTPAVLLAILAAVTIVRVRAVCVSPGIRRGLDTYPRPTHEGPSWLFP